MSALVTAAPASLAADSDGSEETINAVKMLNNEAVMALGRRDYPTAMHSLEKALHLKPSYATGQHNYAVACNNYATSFASDPSKAIVFYRHALFVEPDNGHSQVGYADCLAKIGVESKDFAAHVKMAEACVAADDQWGGIEEYRQALGLKQDIKVQEKLSALEAKKLAPSKFQIAFY